MNNDNILQMMFKIKYSSNNFNKDWEIYHHPTMEFINKTTFYSKYWNIHKNGLFYPYEFKLFNLDIFEIINKTQSNSIRIIHSSIRALSYIPAIIKHQNVYTDDTRNPLFYCNYNITTPSYCLIQYKDWKQSHPNANIIKIIGHVDDIQSFYKYQMMSKCLHVDMTHIPKHIQTQCIQDANEHYLQGLYDTYHNIQDRTQETVITIDPHITKEHDDAFGIKHIHKNQWVISIYITNIPLWLEYYNLWNEFKQRVETIHYPDQKRPLIPSYLSNMFCSFQHHTTRPAFVLDIYVETTLNEANIIHIEYNNAFIYIKEQYTYNDTTLYKEPIYKDIFKICKQLHKKRPFKTLETIECSHDVISYLMLLTNYISACEFQTHQNGIFRSSKPLKLREQDRRKLEHIPNQYKKYIQRWNNTGSQYHLFHNKITHSVMNLDSYVHITSPIRRFVDILNIYQMQINWKLINTSIQSQEFYNYWTSNHQLNMINSSYKSIRKLQDKLNHNINTTHYYNGYVIDRLKRNDGLYQYIIYIHDLNIITRFISTKYKELFQNHYYSIIKKSNHKCMIVEKSLYICNLI